MSLLILLRPVSVTAPETPPPAPLGEVIFTWRGARLGVNRFTVSAHNGSQESDPVDIEVTLDPSLPVSWMLVRDDDSGSAWGFYPVSAPRSTAATVETFRPPGRPYPVHHFWGTSGRTATMRISYLADELPLARALLPLLRDGGAVYAKSQPGYDWDVMRARITGLGPEELQSAGFSQLTVEVDEIGPAVPG